MIDTQAQPQQPQSAWPAGSDITTVLDRLRAAQFASPAPAGAAGGSFPLGEAPRPAPVQLAQAQPQQAGGFDVMDLLAQANVG